MDVVIQVLTKMQKRISFAEKQKREIFEHLIKKEEDFSRLQEVVVKLVASMEQDGVLSREAMIPLKELLETESRPLLPGAKPDLN